jgi:hypothetical protein
VEFVKCPPVEEVEVLDFPEVGGEEVVVGAVDEPVDEPVDEVEVEVEEPPQAPVMEGTAFTPLEIATRFVPQSAALATWRF